MERVGCAHRARTGQVRHALGAVSSRNGRSRALTRGLVATNRERRAHCLRRRRELDDAMMARLETDANSGDVRESRSMPPRTPSLTAGEMLSATDIREKLHMSLNVCGTSDGDELSAPSRCRTQTPNGWPVRARSSALQTDASAKPRAARWFLFSPGYWPPNAQCQISAASSSERPSPTNEDERLARSIRAFQQAAWNSAELKGAHPAQDGTSRCRH